MSSKWICSLAVFSIVSSLQLYSQSDGQVSEELVAADEEDDAFLEAEFFADEPAKQRLQEVDQSLRSSVKLPLSKKAPLAQIARRRSAPEVQEKPGPQEAVEEEKEEPRKRLKAHFAGSKRPPQNVPGYKPVPRVRKSTHVKNEWVTSKTHPKAPKEEEVKSTDKVIASLQKATAFGEGKALSTPRRPSQIFSKEGLLAQAGSDADMPMHSEKKPVEDKASVEEKEYPQTGFIARDGHVYLTGEWLYWRTRQGGMEYAVERSSTTPGVFTDAVSQKLNFEWQSGFRVGLGVHLPRDGWDVYVNYTDFRPEHSSRASGSVFPMLIYQGQFPVANVTEAHAHWQIEFQTLDMEIGRSYYIARTLTFRPNIGVRGAWIDQHAHFHYKGGDIPDGQEYKVSEKNDYKGVGIRAGINTNWQFGGGFSLNGDVFAALIVGHFAMSQDQKQLDDVKVIDLDSNLKLLSPTAQLFLGLSWDRNFYRDRCHFGLTFGFESQYWWRQNQMERFTDSSLPIYVRTDDDLAFYGINLKARIDF